MKISLERIVILLLMFGFYASGCTLFAAPSAVPQPSDTTVPDPVTRRAGRLSQTPGTNPTLTQTPAGLPLSSEAVTRRPGRGSPSPNVTLSPGVSQDTPQMPVERTAAPESQTRRPAGRTVTQPVELQSATPTIPPKFNFSATPRPSYTPVPTATLVPTLSMSFEGAKIAGMSFLPNWEFLVVIRLPDPVKGEYYALVDHHRYECSVELNMPNLLRCTGYAAGVGVYITVEVFDRYAKQSVFLQEILVPIEMMPTVPPAKPKS